MSLRPSKLSNNGLKPRLSVAALLFCPLVGALQKEPKVERHWQQSSLVSNWDYIQALWNGEDLPEDVMINLADQIGTGQHRMLSAKTDSPVPRFTLMGAFDAGTNLFSLTAQLNFPNLRRSNASIWKHSTLGAERITSNMELGLRGTDEKLSDVVLVIMVRSPIANIVSWKKAPYNLLSCLSRPYPTMGTPCIGYTDSDDGRAKEVGYKPRTFQSTMDAYNTYLEQFQALLKETKFKQVLMVNYEDLVLSPEHVMGEFAQACGVSVPAKIQTIDEAAKEHGDAHGRAAALQSLKQRTWMDAFLYDKKGLQTLCKDLNVSVISDRMEGSFLDSSNRIPYSHDCSSL